MHSIPDWHLVGDWFDICSCSIPCQCEVAQAPTNSACQGILAWHVRQGHYGDIRLDALNVLALGAFEGNLWAGEAKVRMGLYIDEKADAQQREALQAVFGGQAGGWPAAFAANIGEVRGIELGFNRSSQRLPEPIAALRREPRRASSIRVSFAACCSGPQLLRPDHQRCGRPGPSASGNTAAANHWCSRSSHVATGCADRRSTLAAPCRPAVVRAAPSPTPGPRSASDGAAQARW